MTLELPDGTVVRPRALRGARTEGDVPDLGLYLGSQRARRKHAPGMPWPQTWLRWPDFAVPRDTDLAVAAIIDAHRNAQRGARVEIACGGGIGRTGTVLACLVVRAGVTDPAEAIAWVRRHHHRRAVETPWQRRWVMRFGGRAGVMES